MRRALLGAGLVVVAVGAIVAPAVAAGSRVGASLSPVPLVSELDDHNLRVANRGDVPVSVALTVSGDPGWVIGPSPTGPLAPGAVVTVPVLAVGQDAAKVTATVTNAAPGMDRTRLVLTGTLRHWNVTEQYPWAVPGIGGLLALGAIIIGAIVVRRRRWAVR